MNLDIIHVHTEFSIGSFGRIIAKQLNIPIVATYHTYYENIKEKIINIQSPYIFSHKLPPYYN